MAPFVKQHKKSAMFWPVYSNDREGERGALTEIEGGEE